MFTAQAERAGAEAEEYRARAAEARCALAVMEAEAQTGDDWAGLTPRQRRARPVARMIVVAGGVRARSMSSR
ncbi:hypothetical protein [Streptomyces sp. NPDC058739]|uniref:hypothetical protein n=1 Tax=Streptomyces sp. NPDC058739 TaxID=3346618 RepID=UPI0036C0059F